MKNTIRRVVDYAVWVAAPLQVYVFGSIAAGTYDANSDLDLLIVVEKKTSKKQISELVRNYALQFSLKTDVLIYTSDEINELKRRPDSFISGALKMAEIMYKKS